MPAPAPAAAHLAAHDLPRRWQGRLAFVLVDSGSGAAERFEATWRAWQADPKACACLVYWIFVEPAWAAALAATDGSPATGEPARAIDHWRSSLSGLLAGVQVRSFEDGRVRLYLAVGPLADLAGERVGEADAFNLEAAPGLGRGLRSTVAALTRRRRPDASLALVNAAGSDSAQPATDAVSAAGFTGFTGFTGGVDALALASASNVPVLAFKARPTRQPVVVDHRWRPLVADAGAIAATHASTHTHTHTHAPIASTHRAAPAPLLPLSGMVIGVVGAGLAGCATAASLARLGARVHLMDRQDRPAAETSGNPAGLVHSVFHHPATPHARLLRAAAVDAALDAGEALHAVPGDGLRPGLLQLQGATSPESMRSALAASGLPAGSVQAVDADGVRQATGLRGTAVQGQAGWLHPRGGWVDPVARCRSWMARGAHTPGGGSIAWHPLTEVQALQRDGGRWRLQASQQGQPAGELSSVTLDAVVVAAAGQASQRLLAPHSDAALWPIEPVRGQLRVWSAQTPGLIGPAMAISGGPYALTLDDGRVLVGATSQPGDDNTATREEDAQRLAGIARDLGVLPQARSPQPAPLPSTLPGDQHRCGVRWRTPDRLPIIGAVLAPAEPQARPTRGDSARFLPRTPGLYAFTALGSRGIAWAHWGAELLASALAGLAAPVESSLLERIDPGRFEVKRRRQPGEGLTASGLSQPTARPGG